MKEKISEKRKLRVGVVGCGYLGKFHAEKFAGMEGVELVGVVDTVGERAQALAHRLGTRAFSTHEALVGKIDAASIVVPTPAHYKVSKDLLQHGVDLMIEKPMTTTLPEADELIALADREGRVLQVGHLERFNPAVVAVKDHIHRPMFIESHRLGIFQGRCTDVSVVLDLMIHDIDIILNFVGSEVEGIHASGASVVSDHTDIANARIQFESGCVANVTASRISIKNERKIRIFQKNSYIAVDFAKREITRIEQTGECTDSLIPGMKVSQLSFEEGDALKDELSSFVASVRSRRQPEVTGRMGYQALRIALDIMDQIEAAHRRFGLKA
ncbi:MAG: Gfo/Idh/MocA family protein [Desulfobacterales bacterium]